MEEHYGYYTPEGGMTPDDHFDCIEASARTLELRNELIAGGGHSARHMRFFAVPQDGTEAPGLREADNLTYTPYRNESTYWEDELSCWKEFLKYKHDMFAATELLRSPNERLLTLQEVRQVILFREYRDYYVRKVGQIDDSERLLVIVGLTTRDGRLTPFQRLNSIRRQLKAILDEEQPEWTGVVAPDSTFEEAETSTAADRNTLQQGYHLVNRARLDTANLRSNVPDAQEDHSD